MNTSGFKAILFGLCGDHTTKVRGSTSNMHLFPVRDISSPVDAIFCGVILDAPVYSVVHSRSLEDVGIYLSKMVSDKFGWDPIGALDLQPEYVKAILEALDLLKHPIIFMTDNQRPEILERLLADPDIGPNILLGKEVI